LPKNYKSNQIKPLEIQSIGLKKENNFKFNTENGINLNLSYINIKLRYDSIILVNILKNLSVN
jgi:hypothetical protein